MVPLPLLQVTIPVLLSKEKGGFGRAMARASGVVRWGLTSESR
jgi:hypothetical protein